MAIIANDNTARIAGIRRLVSVGYDDTDLTDADITSDAFLGFANRYIERRVPTHADLEGDQEKDLEVAVQKKCAVEMLKATARVLQIDRESTGATMEMLSIEQTIMQYEEDIEDIIVDLVPETITGASPYFKVIELSDV